MNFLTEQCEKLARWIGRWPAGCQVAALVVVLVFGRWLWLLWERPAHVAEIAAGYGSVNLFYDDPQPDAAGKRVTYVATAPKGYGVFLADAATGRKKLAYNEFGLGIWGDVSDLHVWPWAPDDSIFVYTAGRRLTLCDAVSQTNLAQFELPTNITDLAWLTPTSFVFAGRVCPGCLCQKQPDGTWGWTNLAGWLSAGGADAFKADAEALNAVTTPMPHVIALSSRRIAWWHSRQLWSLDLDSGAASLLVDLARVGLGDVSPNNYSYDKSSGLFLIDTSPKNGATLWVLDPGYSPPGLRPMTPGAVMHHAVWLPGQEENGWLGIGHYVKNHHPDTLLTAENASVEPGAPFPEAKVYYLTMSAEGQRLFMIGSMGMEVDDSLWMYDFSSSQLSCVAPYSDFPSPYAKRMEPVSDSFLTDKGKYSIFLPEDIYRHPRRKHPLILGNSMFGNTFNGPHGRLWVPAMAACDAIVMFVNRPQFTFRLAQWGEDIEPAYQQALEHLPVNQSRMYLFAVSAETRYACEYLANSPERWRGVMFLNPGGLPDLARLAAARQKPKFLLCSGELEGQEQRLSHYQEEALQAGVIVEYTEAPGEGHHFVGNASQLQRTRAMIHFVFEE